MQQQNKQSIACLADKFLAGISSQAVLQLYVPSTDCHSTARHNCSLVTCLYPVLQEVEAAVRLLDEESQRLALSSGYGLKLLPLPLYAGVRSSETCCQSRDSFKLSTN